MKRVAISLLLAAGLFFVTDDVSAQEKKGGVITINEVTIVGRVQKPVASVDGYADYGAGAAEVYLDLTARFVRTFAAARDGNL